MACVPDISPYIDDALIAPRQGRIVVERGVLRRIDALWIPRRFTIWRVWRDARVRTGGDDTCTLYYRGTRATPGYLTLDYVRSGPRTTFASFRRALVVLDEIARLRQSVAIFAHVSTSAISDRLLRRWGWDQHAARLGGRHWIKRFYDGYPAYAASDGRSSGGIQGFRFEPGAADVGRASFEQPHGTDRTGPAASAMRLTNGSTPGFL